MTRAPRLGERIGLETMTGDSNPTTSGKTVSPVGSLAPPTPGAEFFALPSPFRPFAVSQPRPFAFALTESPL
jgi:hypothetical protein